MRILGIDPGLATIGLGLIEHDEKTRRSIVLEWLTITTPAGMPLGSRLKELSSDLATYLDETTPELVVIEKLFFATNKQTAIDVAQARGAILLTVEQRGIQIIEPTPLQLKIGVTGDGKADKKQMQDMMMRTLKLIERPQPDDAADALALAIYGTTNMFARGPKGRSPIVYAESRLRPATESAA